uniref:Protein FAM196B n=1 Tax=Callorhinchus milii TaxID=7868 RepID=A0A4W3GW30_CALMI
MVSREDSHPMAPSVNCNSDRTMTVRSVLLKRDSGSSSSNEADRRPHRRRQKAQQVRFKDLADGPEEDGGRRALETPDGRIAERESVGPHVPPRSWRRSKPCSLTLPNPRTLCMSTAIQTSPSLQKQSPMFRYRSQSMGDFSEASNTAPNGKEEPGEPTLTCQEAQRACPASSACRPAGGNPAGNPGGKLKGADDRLQCPVRTDPSEHPRGIPPKTCQPSSHDLKPSPASTQVDDIKSRSTKDQLDGEASFSAIVEPGSGSRGPIRDHVSDLSYLRVSNPDFPKSCLKTPPTSLNAKLPGLSDPSTPELKAEPVPLTPNGTAQQGERTIDCSKLAPTPDSPGQQQAVAKALPECPRSPRGGVKELAGAEGCRPIHTRQYEISSLQTRLQTMEDVLQTSQKTIKILLDVIQDLEKKEATKDGRQSYRTGQDITNCGTCRDCVCIIYSVEHDFRQQEVRFHKVLSDMEMGAWGQNSEQPGTPLSKQEESPIPQPTARTEPKKSKRKCFWFL